MNKCKVKIGISYLVLVVACLIYGQFLLIINYSLALVLHELMHVFVALKKGYRVRKIKIDMLGMHIDISDNIDANDHFFIALAGPLFNFVMCVMCCALWWIIPESYFFTASFFSANLLLAIFNILPIEPLDGGVMLNLLLTKKSKKLAKIISLILNVAFILIFILLFIISFDSEPNLILLIFAIFFATNIIKSRKKINYDVYYKALFKKNMPITKVNLLKVDETISLLECFKQIKPNNFVVFYSPNIKGKYLSEIDLQMLITKYDVRMSLKQALEKESN